MLFVWVFAYNLSAQPKSIPCNKRKDAIRTACAICRVFVQTFLSLRLLPAAKATSLVRGRKKSAACGQPWLSLRFAQSRYRAAKRKVTAHYLRDLLCGSPHRVRCARRHRLSLRFAQRRFRAIKRKVTAHYLRDSVCPAAAAVSAICSMLIPGGKTKGYSSLPARFTARWHAPGNPRRRRAHRIRAGSVRYAFLSKAGICLLQFEARTRAAGHSESRCALAHNKSWLLLRNKNNLVLPTSASTVFCRGGSPCPPARFQQR